MVFLRGYGCHSGGETPGSIPNPVAKLASADGTALGRVWESRTQPDIFYMGVEPHTGWCGAPFICVGLLVWVPSCVGLLCSACVWGFPGLGASFFYA